MPIAFACPGCRKTIKAKESLAGRTLPCPGCGHALTVPAAASDAQSTVNIAPVQKAPAKPTPSSTAAPKIAPNEVAKPRDAAPIAPASPPAAKAAPLAQDEMLPWDDLPTAAGSKERAGVMPWDDPEESEFKLQPLEAPPAKPALSETNPYVSPQADLSRPKLKPAAAADAPLKPSLAFRVAASNPKWQRRMLWAFVLALIPLAFNILLPDGSDHEKRFEETIDQMELGKQLEVVALIEQAKAGEVAGFEKNLFSLLPDQRLKGSFLGYDSYAHWFMAFGASLLFLGLLVAMAMDGSTRVGHLLLISFFTATGGVLLLLGFQFLADWAVNTDIRGRGIVVLLFWIVKLIGFSYRAAMIEGNGFIESMLGFTFGVGLCEEFCKAIPLFIYFKNSDTVTWRGAMLWGLASGIGFGIAEGIMYCGDYYNGRAYAGIYFVRFFSCVALHAIWTASVAITLYRRQAEWQSADELYEHAFVVLKIIAIPMLLHGLYDTLLKQEYATYALLTAAASFGYLGWLNYHCERHE